MRFVLFFGGLITAMICGNLLIVAAIREGIYKAEPMDFLVALGCYLGALFGAGAVGVWSAMEMRRTHERNERHG